MNIPATLVKATVTLMTSVWKTLSAGMLAAVAGDQGNTNAVFQSSQIICRTLGLIRRIFRYLCARETVTETSRCSHSI